METSEASNLLLKKKYDLHKRPEVVSAAKRREERTGEKVSQDPLLQIQNYLNRFHEITDRDNPKDREHGMDASKRFLYSKFVIKPESIPEGYFENQRRLARELGHGDVDITQDVRNQLTDVIIADQKSSLDKWVDYLSSPDAPYSDALKYFTLRSVLSIGEYDKEKHAFGQRSKGSVKPFPDLNREALGYVLDAIDKKYKGVALAQHEPEFEKLINGENFSKLYAWAIDKVTPASVDQLVDTRGRWIKYAKNSDPMPLVQSLQGHGTGWCTAAESTAATQLKGGDFYVYYSLDQNDTSTIPRVAIRMQEGSIAEVRGIAAEQNLDPYINDVVIKKLEEFPDGKLYQKKAADMKHLTAVEYKTTAGYELSREDVTFLYEINNPIDGFGYEKDPRIEELRSVRNPDEDMLVVFNCESSQIARTVDEINRDTRAFVGKLEPGIFNLLKKHQVEHIFTAFPEGKIRFDTVTIGGKSKEKILEELTQNNIQMSSYAEDMIKNPDFKITSTPIGADVVRLHVGDISGGEYITTKDLYAKAEGLGLTLCPPEIGTEYRLKYMNQPLGEWLYIGMKQISDRDGDPDVFSLGHDVDGLWLNVTWVYPGNTWSPDDEFVFSLRK